MNLDLVKPSEVSQKEKNNFRILTQTYANSKNGSDEPICRVWLEMQT